MIQSAFWNGIDFSGNFNRENSLFNFEAQRVKNVLNRMVDIKYLSFFYTGTEPEMIHLKAISKEFELLFFPTEFFEYNGGFFFNFEIPEDNLGIENSPTYFEVIIDESEKICSEIYNIKSTDYFTENKIIHISAYNNDARRGIITEIYPAFGFFQTTGFNEDVFVNTKTEYEYSYNRKKILSSENNIAKRLTFVNLSMYQQNLLKWLCNCENLLIDGVQYELISDFTELLSDENSEVKDLRADFIPTNQSFFGNGSTIAPKNVFPTEFFMK